MRDASRHPGIDPALRWSRVSGDRRDLVDRPRRRADHVGSLCMYLAVVFRRGKHNLDQADVHGSIEEMRENQTAKQVGPDTLPIRAAISSTRQAD